MAPLNFVLLFCYIILALLSVFGLAIDFPCLESAASFALSAPSALVPSLEGLKQCEGRGASQQYCLASLGELGTDEGPIGGEAPGGTAGFCLPTSCDAARLSGELAAVCRGTSVCLTSLSEEKCSLLNATLCAEARRRSRRSEGADVVFRCASSQPRLGSGVTDCNSSRSPPLVRVETVERSSLEGALICAAPLASDSISMATWGGLNDDAARFEACPNDMQQDIELKKCEVRVLTFGRSYSCLPRRCGDDEFRNMMDYVCRHVPRCVSQQTMLPLPLCLTIRAIGCPIPADPPICSEQWEGNDVELWDKEVARLRYSVEGIWAFTNNGDVLSTLSSGHQQPRAFLEAGPLLVHKLREVSKGTPMDESRLDVLRHNVDWLGEETRRDSLIRQWTSYAQPRLIDLISLPFVQRLYRRLQHALGSEEIIRATGVNATPAAAREVFLFCSEGPLPSSWRGLPVRTWRLAASLVAVYCLLYSLQVAALYMRWSKNKDAITSRVGQIVECFDPIENTRRIFNTANSDKESMGFIHGVRACSMLWVVLGHTVSFMAAFMTIKNMQRLVDGIRNSVWLQFIISGQFAVDSFFVLTGFLLPVCWLPLLRDAEAKGKNESWVSRFLTVVIQRYIRITLPYALLILLATVGLTVIRFPFILPETGFILTEGMHGGCSRLWWTNLLHINNIYPPGASSECVMWGWYLANDMQFFVLGTLLVLLYLKRPLVASVCVASLCGISWVVSACLVVQKNISALYNGVSGFPNTVDLPDPIILPKMFTEFYIAPWIRVPPFLIGFAAGLVCVDSDFVQRRFKTLFAWKEPSEGYLSPQNRAVTCRRTAWLGGTKALMLLLAVMPYWFTRTWWKRWMDVLYLAMARSAWSILLAILLLAMLFDVCDIPNRIMSWKCWVPLSRLSFGVYLLHPVVQVSILTLEEKVDCLDTMSALLHYLAFVSLSLLGSWNLNLMVEVPLLRLVSAWKNKKKKVQ